MTAQFERVAEVEADHWWFVTLRERVQAEIRALVGPDGRVLDAGCGTGRMLGELTEYETTGLDVNPHVLEFAQQSYHDMNWVPGSVVALPFDDMSFDAVLSLDVLYAAGVEDDLLAAREMHRVLCPGGVAIVNLPAYEWLISGHDLVANTARRYTVRRTNALLNDAGFATVRTSYRVGTLLPIAIARRLMLKHTGPVSDVGRIPSWLNRAFLAINRGENRLARQGLGLPFGLSVFAIARR
jgi:ubiquinone/menaquinone biosynthesis C-methylase UbiE